MADTNIKTRDNGGFGSRHLHPNHYRGNNIEDNFKDKSLVFGDENGDLSQSEKKDSNQTKSINSLWSGVKTAVGEALYADNYTTRTFNLNWNEDQEDSSWIFNVASSNEYLAPEGQKTVTTAMRLKFDGIGYDSYANLGGNGVSVDWSAYNGDLQNKGAIDAGKPINSQNYWSGLPAPNSAQVVGRMQTQTVSANHSTIPEMLSASYIWEAKPTTGNPSWSSFPAIAKLCYDFFQLNMYGSLTKTATNLSKTPARTLLQVATDGTMLAKQVGTYANTAAAQSDATLLLNEIFRVSNGDGSFTIHMKGALG